MPPKAVAAPGNIAGMIVFLDPGHNGANDASISRQVPTGRGGTKDCQASGTTTNDGYPEHTFTWDTTLRIRAELNALGARTAMSRGDDSTVGPCVDQRAAMANALHPNAVVSIHADGGPPNGRGFPRELLRAAAQPGAGGPVGAVRPGHARPDPGLGYSAGQLHRPGRPLRAFGPGRPEPRAVSIGPGRVRQHEKPGRLSADGVARRAGRSMPTPWSRASPPSWAAKARRASGRSPVPSSGWPAPRPGSFSAPAARTSSRRIPSRHPLLSTWS